MAAQDERLDAFQEQLTKEIKSLQQLHQLIDKQQQQADKFNNTLDHITASIASLEKLTNKILQNQQAPSSPERPQPIKRAKLSEVVNSPTNRFKPLTTDPMDASDQWDDQDPNISPPHSRASSPSL